MDGGRAQRDRPERGARVAGTDAGREGGLVKEHRELNRNIEGEDRKIGAGERKCSRRAIEGLHLNHPHRARPQKIGLFYVNLDFQEFIRMYSGHLYDIDLIQVDARL
jgi:hypothetical protein